jgi:acyl carrier protein
MNDLDSLKTLKAILADLGIPSEVLRADTLLHQDLQLDSTEIVEISLGLKRRLGVSIKLESRQDMTLAEMCHKIKAAQLTETKATLSPEESVS